MKNSPIIFCHYGNSKYLPYVFKCAKISNPNAEIILLGDDSNLEVARSCGISHFQLKDYDFGEELKKFDQLYELISTPSFDGFKHGEDWNKFVFRKWLMLDNFLRQHQIERFWHFDSDNMIFTDLSTLEHKYLHLDCTVQCMGKCMKGFFSNREIIERYNEKINEVFARKDFIAQVKKEMSKESGPSCFNEMNVYEIFQQEENFKYLRLSAISDNSSFDDLICRPDGMKMHKLPLGEDSKIVYMNLDGRFFCIEEATNKPIEMHALNLSWIPIYIFAGILKHFKKYHGKPHQNLSPKAKTLAQIPIPLKQKLKFLRKSLKKKFKG